MDNTKARAAKIALISLAAWSVTTLAQSGTSTTGGASTADPTGGSSARPGSLGTTGSTSNPTGGALTGSAANPGSTTTTNGSPGGAGTVGNRGGVGGPGTVPSLSATPDQTSPRLSGPSNSDHNPSASGRSSRSSGTRNDIGSGTSGSGTSSGSSATMGSGDTASPGSPSGTSGSTSSTSGHTGSSTGPSSSGAGTGSPSSTGSGTSSTAGSGMTGMNGQRWDAQVLSFVRAVDSLEAESARMAQTKARHPQVKSFARTMISAHESDRAEVQRLMSRLGLGSTTSGAEPSSVAELRSAASDTTQKLNGLSGTEFDKAYITAQVDMHRKVLNAIDSDLMPRAESAEVKSLLQKTRPKIEAHLKQAEQIQAQLK